MEKRKMSGPAIFMHTVIIITIIISAVCFGIYYSNICKNGIILWTGITAFMIMYHFWLRIIMGNVSKLFKINQNHWWFKEKSFEKKLFKLIRIRKWKDKVLTYNPEAFSLTKHSLEEVAAVMTKSELDHWLNELIALSSILFSLIWGEFWIFLITAIAAMLFDAQFILVQRYNRPKIMHILAKRKKYAFA